LFADDVDEPDFFAKSLVCEQNVQCTPEDISFSNLNEFTLTKSINNNNKDNLMLTFADHDYSCSLPHTESSNNNHQHQARNATINITEPSPDHCTQSYLQQSANTLQSNHQVSIRATQSFFLTRQRQHHACNNSHQLKQREQCHLLQIVISEKDRNHVNNIITSLLPNKYATQTGNWHCCC
jgi:alkaline phosphatase